MPGKIKKYTGEVVITSKRRKIIALGAGSPEEAEKAIVEKAGRLLKPWDEECEVTVANLKDENGKGVKGAWDWLVVQEGGSSGEMYVNFYLNEDDALAFKEDAWDNGGYRTSDVVKIPRRLAEDEKFRDVVEIIVDKVTEMLV